MKKRKLKIEKLHLNKAKITTLNCEKQLNKIKGGHAEDVKGTFCLIDNISG